MQTQSNSTQSVTSLPKGASSLRVTPTAKGKRVTEVVQLNRVNLKSVIERQDGLFCSVDFIKAERIHAFSP